MTKIYFHTFGCKVNQYDTQAMREAALSVEGFAETRDPADADVCVVNTCAVTHAVEAKCRKALRALRKAAPGARIVAAGCYVNRNREKLEGMEEVDSTLPNEEKNNLLKLLTRGEASDAPSCSGLEGRTRALLKIQDGCENFCAYCVVPFLRGPERSRSVEKVLDEAAGLADAGHGEIVVTGIHLGRYLDEAAGYGLPDLVEKLGEIENLRRIRLSSVDAYDLPDETVKRLAEIDKLCEHFHLPLQSGDDGILAKMGRRYDSDEFRSRVDSLRTHFDEPGITTDVIVGFPGEDEEAFRNSLNAVKETGFSRTHIFTFSPREGTKAWNMKPGVNPKVAAERYRRLKEAALEASENFAGRLKDRTAEVMVETDGAGGEPVSGYSRRYMRIEFPGQAPAGTIRKVRITGPGFPVSVGEMENEKTACANT